MDFAPSSVLIAQEGRTVATFTADCEYIASGGASGVVQLFQVGSDGGLESTDVQPVDTLSSICDIASVHNSKNSNKNNSNSNGNKSESGNDNGYWLIAALENGLVKLYRGPSLSFECTLMRCSLPAKCIAISPDSRFIVVGSDDRHVRVISVSDLENISKKSNNNNNENDNDNDNDNENGEDDESKIELIELSPLDGSPKCISINSNGTRMAIITDSGSLLVYQVNRANNDSNVKFNIEKSMRKFSPSTLTSKYNVSIKWHPVNPNILACSNINGGVVVLESTQSTWSTKFVLGIGAPTPIVSTIDWKLIETSNKNNGSKKIVFLAAGLVDGQLAIWNVETQSFVTKYKLDSDSSFNQIVWHPSSNSLLASDDTGQLLLWESVTDHLIASSSNFNTNNEHGDVDDDDDDAMWANGVNIDELDGDVATAPLSGNSNNNIHSKSSKLNPQADIRPQKLRDSANVKNKQNSLKKSTARDGGNGDPEEDDDDEGELIEDNPQTDSEEEEGGINNGGNGSDLDDFIEYDDNDNDNDDDRPIKPRPSSTSFSSSQSSMRKSQRSKSRSESATESLAYLRGKASSFSSKMAAIHPGSTPWLPGSNKRYMCINLIGSITCIDHGSHHSISIEFHDKSVHRDIQFTDYSGISMAYLSTDGALFATSGKLSDGESLATLSYRSHSGWSSNGDWSIEMLPGEYINNIALTNGHAVVATSLNYLRVFTSIGGIQRGLISLPNQILCLATASSGDELAVIQSNHSNELIVSTFQLMHRAAFPLRRSIKCEDVKIATSPGSALTWAGYIEDGGALCTFDSVGVLRVLHSQSNCWIPIYFDSNNIKSGKCNHFAIGLAEGVLFTIKLASGSRYPSHPLPALSELKVSLPFTNPKDPSTIHEEQLAQSAISSDILGYSARDQVSKDNRNSEHDKLLLRIFQQACVSERQERALEIASMFINPKGIELAEVLAQRAGLHGLVERLQHLQDAVRSNELPIERVYNDDNGNDNGDVGDDDSAISNEDDGATEENRHIIRQKQKEVRMLREVNPLKTSANQSASRSSASIEAQQAKQPALSRRSINPFAAPAGSVPDINTNHDDSDSEQTGVFDGISSVLAEPKRKEVGKTASFGTGQDVAAGAKRGRQSVLGNFGKAIAKKPRND
ncbi:WD40 repeat-like protein [Ramicandelaber brevisporus]|nr:WD40 repeat-like protein [Ramicandelaber brevisporus]